MSAVEALVYYVVQQHHHVCRLVLQAQVDDVKVVVGVEHVQVLNHLFICDVALTETCSLVEHRQRVSHSAVGLLRYHVQRLFLVSYAFLVGHHLQVVDDVGHRHALKVINLTA